MNIWVAARCGNLDAAANPAIHAAARGVAARGGALTLRVPRAYMTPPLAGWQSGYATDCKSVYSGSIPLPASKRTMARHCWTFRHFRAYQLMRILMWLV